MKKIGIILLVAITLFFAYYSFALGVIIFKIAVGLMLLCIAVVGGIIGYHIGKQNNCNVAKKAFDAGKMNTIQWDEYKQQNHI